MPLLGKYMKKYKNNNYEQISKNMIVLVHENHDKLPNDTPVQHVCSGFDHANLVSFFTWFHIIKKLNSVMYIYFRIRAHKTFCFKR